VDLVLVSLNHKTAPVELRERFALAGDALGVALASLHARLPEVIILSTCNRLEIYAAAESADDGMDAIITFLTGQHALNGDALHQHLYCLHGGEVALHLMRVASGLESLVLGETQILGQVAQALRHAQVADSAGALLTRLFSDALHTGKRAQSETGISQHSLSVSDAAVALLRKQIDFSVAQVLVVGAGEMAERAVRALHKHDASRVRVVSRTDANAQRLAERFGAQPRGWHELPAALDDVDAVITALSVSEPLLDSSSFEALSPKTRTVVDMGVPRNVAPEVGLLPNVRLYDIDDMQSVVHAQVAEQKIVVAQVETLCAEAAESYGQWWHTRQVVPLITELRQQAETVAALEVEQALRRLPSLSSDQQEIVSQMAHRIVSKLLHAPTVGLKERAATGDHFDYSHAVRALFALDAERLPDE
jgi:glutamyl-tRNA reductase